MAGFVLSSSGVIQVMSAPLILIWCDKQFEEGSDFIKFLGLLLVYCMEIVGCVVSIGGMRMRKRKNFNFCRIASILAMLPLGPGFVIGLPCGIWILRLLRKPEVKAAFEGKIPVTK